jgi:hypothetical protein
LPRRNEAEISRLSGFVLQEARIAGRIQRLAHLASAFGLTFTFLGFSIEYIACAQGTPESRDVVGE